MPSPAWAGPLRERVARVGGEHIRGSSDKGTEHDDGGDWLLLRSDGVPLLDVRVTPETDDGALIYMSCRGLRHHVEDQPVAGLFVAIAGVLAAFAAPALMLPIMQGKRLSGIEVRMDGLETGQAETRGEIAEVRGEVAGNAKRLARITAMQAELGARPGRIKDGQAAVRGELSTTNERLVRVEGIAAGMLGRGPRTHGASAPSRIRRGQPTARVLAADDLREPSGGSDPNSRTAPGILRRSGRDYGVTRPRSLRRRKSGICAARIHEGKYPVFSNFRTWKRPEMRNRGG